MDSKYADGVFNFYLAYHVEAGAFSYELNTLQLTGQASAKAKKVKALNATKNANKKTIVPFLHKGNVSLFSIK